MSTHNIFKPYWTALTPAEKMALAKAIKRPKASVESTYTYLSMIANGHRRFSYPMALRVQRYTKNKLKHEKLLPGI